MFKEFLGFLKEHGIMALAIAVVLGGKLNALVTALVDGILMPIINPLIPGGDWRKATVVIGEIELKTGIFAAALLDFAIVGFVVFLVARRLIRQEKAAAAIP